MSESAYLLVFGDSSDAFFRFFGVDEQYRASGRSLYTVETHLRHLREARLGDRLRLTLQALGVDGKRLHILHEMYGAGAELVATAEQLLVHADTRSGRSAPFPELIAGGWRRSGPHTPPCRCPGMSGTSSRSAAGERPWTSRLPANSA